MIRTRLLTGMLAILLCIAGTGYSDPLKVHMGVGVEEKYNDNVFFDTENTQEDFITQISPRLQGGWDSETVDFMLTGRADIYDYMDNDTLDAIDQSYDGLLARHWSPRFSTSFSAAYLRDERRERELLETGLLFDDDTRERQTYNVGGQYSLSELSALNLSYTYQIETFEDELAYDLALHSIQFGISRDLSAVVQRSTGRLTISSGYYEYQRDYAAVDAALGNLRSNVDDEQVIENYALRLGLNHKRTERLAMDLEMGARYTRTERTQSIVYEPNPFFSDQTIQDKSDSWGYVASLSVDYVGEKWAMNLLASHDLVPASGREGTTERTTLRWGGNRRFGSRWYGNWSARGYLNRSDESGVTSETDELTVHLHGGLRYAFNPSWSLGAYWYTTWIDDRVKEEERTQNAISLRLRWEWSMFD